MYIDPPIFTIDPPGHLEGNRPFIYPTASLPALDHFATSTPEYSLDELKEHYTSAAE